MTAESLRDALVRDMLDMGWGHSPVVARRIDAILAATRAESAAGVFSAAVEYRQGFEAGHAAARAESAAEVEASLIADFRAHEPEKYTVGGFQRTWTLIGCFCGWQGMGAFADHISDVASARASARAESVAGSAAEVERLRRLVERSAAMGYCSQTGHEHLMRDAQVALATPAPEAKP